MKHFYACLCLCSLPVIWGDTTLFLCLRLQSNDPRTDFWSEGWFIGMLTRQGSVVWLCAHSSGRFQGDAFRTVSYSVASRGRGQSLAPISSGVTPKGSGCFYPRLESSFVLGLPNFTIGLGWHPLVVRKGRETWRCCPSQKFGSHWLSESRFTVPSPGVGVG